MEKKYDAIVIGSGHNGLVAAAYLAKAGKSVLVLEKNETFGGATASQQVFPDYEAWLSRYSYLISLLPAKIIDDLGLQFETRRRTTASFTPWKDSAGKPRGLVLSNIDLDRSRDSMYQMTGRHRDWERYQEFLSLQSRIAKLIWPSMLNRLRSRASFKDQLQTQEDRAAWNAFVEQPLGESIEAYAEHDALRGLLMTDGKIGVFTHAHDPNLLQNRCFLYHIIGNETGEWRVPVGGMASLVNSLLKQCQKLGVDLKSNANCVHLETGHPFHEVTFESDAVVHAVSGENILVNAGPGTFDRLLGQPTEPKLEDEGSVVKINMLLKRLPKLKATDVSAEEAFAGSFHIDEGYRQMEVSYESARRGEVPDPSPGEVYCHTLTDGSILSPELQERGFHTLTLFGLDMPWRLFESDHENRKQRVADLFLSGLNELCEDSFEECLARDADGRPCFEIKTPQDLHAEVGLDQGNIFHNALSWFYGEESQVGSWGVETDHPRVFKAGSSAMRGGAVSGIPGHNAAMCILQQAE